MKKIIFCFFLVALVSGNILAEQDITKKEAGWLRSEIRTVAKELWAEFISPARDVNKTNELLGLLTQMEILLGARSSNGKSVYFSKFSELNLPAENNVAVGSMPMNILAVELWNNEKIKLDLRSYFKLTTEVTENVRIR